MKKLAWILALLMLLTACSKKEPATLDPAERNDTQANTPAKTEITYTPVTGTVGVPEAIHFPAAMYFSQTQYLYESNPKNGYYISVGALVSGMQTNAAYLWFKDSEEGTLITLPTDGVCKGITGNDGVYYTFDNQGAAYAWFVSNDGSGWKTEGNKITPPDGYYVSQAASNPWENANWFVVLSGNDKSDRILATFDCAETFTELDVSALVNEYGTMTVCSIDHGNSSEYAITVKFADGTRACLVGSMADKENYTAVETDSTVEPAPMYTDGTTVLPILG